MHMTYKHYLGRVLSVEDPNWSVWEKGFWNSKFFFSEHMSVRLSEP